MFAHMPGGTSCAGDVMQHALQIFVNIKLFLLALAMMGQSFSKISGCSLAVFLLLFFAAPSPPVGAASSSLLTTPPLLPSFFGFLALVGERNLSGNLQWKIACFATVLLFSIMLYSGRSGSAPDIFPIAKNCVCLKIVHTIATVERSRVV